MDHDALLALFRRLALASAPLVAGGCNNTFGGNCNIPSEELTASVDSLRDGAAPDPLFADGGLDDLCSRAAPNRRIEKCELVTVDGGQAVHVVYMQYCLGGRRPPGLLSPEGPGNVEPLGAWLSGIAHLEAASVDAFRILADELDVHGAPRDLVGAARAAAGDERRHARIMGRLARAAGARPPAVRVERRAPRDLETVARENAVEGCVRETFAALVAWRQARAAADRSIREAMAGIAPDETRHAALSWAVDAWARAQLSPAARRRVREARESTTALLALEVAVTEPAALRVPAGLPHGDEAVAMAAALFAELA